MRILSIFAVLFLLLGQWLAISPPAQAASPAVTNAALATVQIVTFDRRGKALGWGSGVLINPAGRVLTNYHVIAQNRQPDGRVAIWLPNSPEASQSEDFILYWGSVLDKVSDPAADLALVQIELTADEEPLPAGTKFPTLPLGDSAALRVDDEIRILGYPGLAGGSLTTVAGRIIGRQEEEGLPWLLTDAIISGGNSGGAVINQAGELVAIPTMTLTDEDSGNTFGYLRPIKLARPLIEHADDVGPNTGREVEVLCADDFTSNKNGWSLGYEEGKLLGRENTIDQGTLHTQAEFYEDAFGWLTIPNCTVQDFVFIVDVHSRVPIDQNSGVVLILRAEETKAANRYYQVIYYLNNTYEVNVLADGEWLTLRERTRNRAIDLSSGQVNRLAVGLIGEQMTLYANDEVLETITDATLLGKGTLGLGVIGGAGETLDVRFDNLQIINPIAQDTILYDQFVDNHNGWQLGRLNDKQVDCEDKIVAGRLEHRIRIKEDNFSCHSLTDKLVAQDFWLTVDAIWQEANTKGSWITISFRSDDQTNNQYQVRVDNTGYYIVELYLNDEWHTIQDWTQSRAFTVEKGQANTLQLWVRDAYITLYANGVELTTVENDQLPNPGQIMLGAGGEAGLDNLLIYDNLVVRQTPPTAN